MKQNENETKDLGNFNTREGNKQILKSNIIKMRTFSPPVASCKMLFYNFCIATYSQADP